MFIESEIDVNSMYCRLIKKDFAIISVGFDIHGKEELNRILDKLRKIDGVTDITRTAGLERFADYDKDRIKSIGTGSY